LVIEPDAGEYDLPLGQQLLVHVYGRSLGPDDKDADIEIEHSPGRLTIWLASRNYRVFDDRGNELRSL
jgi:hypothetical protein